MQQTPVDEFYAGRVAFDVSLYGVGIGPTRLDKYKRFIPTKGGEPAIGDIRKHYARLMSQVVWFNPGDRDIRFSGLDDPNRPYQIRLYKTGPAFALSKTIRGITYDEAGAVIPFCKVLVFNTATNVLIARTVSDANGAYSVTVPS
jgi:hypothetical protein